ncbi:helix-turn-helix domain-containing protein [Micromonospora sp. NPDC006766]|uniref:helix-turn-helix domain-containing protein n=1 Tax=Micromonospora sp. NPDC006766 TaxID=3154778 RepID=UPI0033EAC8C6
MNAGQVGGDVTGDELPIGRRVARWRVRQRMTQQMLADRLGKSKSWVDKVERGARVLDKYSVIQEIATVLRVDPAMLLGQHRPSPPVLLVAVDGVRAALARYDAARTGEPGDPVSVTELGRQVGHLWLTYQHADYPQVLRTLPGLLDAAQRLHSVDPVHGMQLLVSVYRIMSSVLVKLGEADLGWLAADRAVATAGDDPVLAGAAAVSIGHALRALGRGRLAMAATVAAAHRIAPVRLPEGSGKLAVQGALLLQAALAAAGCVEGRRVEELTDQAIEIAAWVDAREDPHQTSFGLVAVELARIVAAVELGNAEEAVYRHEQAIRREAWRLLPAEYRAAYLVDAARAYLQVGDLRGAGRVLVDADGIAPAEVRCRPAARTVIAELARSHLAPAGVARLATLVGLTR